ncbi:thiol reductase thioredoxin [Rubrivivax gelatinosus]|uniref:thioredoxin family protein n=1 Tax=Rubrivivax gelatinosus TaxID=28068 RepID=UPI001904FBA0|nr:thioredoxin family protein [Rubrivivax gelatinosus]MBK1616164.1 thiol reductase thioredoxin [Rubrivivax gelatinosus]
MDSLPPDREPTRAEVDAFDGPLVLEFGTGWCPHCLGAQPLIAAARAGYPAITHRKIEDGRGQPLGRSFAVKLWPTLVFINRGQELARVVRPQDGAELERAFQALAAAA